MQLYFYEFWWGGICPFLTITAPFQDNSLIHILSWFFFNRLIVSVAWIAHIVIYLLIDPPLSPFLNWVFIKLDDVWGTCFYISHLSLAYHGVIMTPTFLNFYCFSRSFGHCSICVFLLLPSSCSDGWGYDAWLEISFHHDPSNEVMNLIVLNTFVLFCHPSLTIFCLPLLFNVLIPPGYAVTLEPYLQMGSYANELVSF